MFKSSEAMQLCLYDWTERDALGQLHGPLAR